MALISKIKKRENFLATFTAILSLDEKYIVSNRGQIECIVFDDDAVIVRQEN